MWLLSLSLLHLVTDLINNRETGSNQIEPFGVFIDSWAILPRVFERVVYQFEGRWIDPWLLQFASWSNLGQDTKLQVQYQHPVCMCV